MPLWMILASLAASAMVTPAAIYLDRSTTRQVLPSPSAPWVMVTWIAVGSGSQTATPTTEKQCKAMVAAVNAWNDPMVIFCLGPDGERMETIPAQERMRRSNPKAFVQPLPMPTPPSRAEL